MDPIIKLRKQQIDESANPSEPLRRIEFNITELCNRTCWFCPRSDHKIYKNRGLHMPIEVAMRINGELMTQHWRDQNLNLSFAGFGEPLLHKQHLEVFAAVTKGGMHRSEIITNGDFLNHAKIEEIYKAGIERIVVNNYESAERGEHYRELFSDRPREKYHIRDNYEGNMQLNLTNRAGSAVNVENAVTLPRHRACFIPFYSLVIDWNGDAILCGNDWQRQGLSGLNIMQRSLLDIWQSTELQAFRDMLMRDRRDTSPCNACDIDGQMVGRPSFDWFKGHSEALRK
ncbi:MAG: SPASM domain-containing protein [Alphaproteobacteria bacterium]|nr:SPASM domain-containing protein [Alphaproteobacteria bacterium]